MKIKMKSFLILFAAFSLMSCGDSQVAATINGKPIYTKDLDQAFGGRIAQQIYNMRKNTLDDLIDQKILEQAAAEKKMTVDALLKAEVDAKLTEPTDEEIKAIYDSNKDKFGGDPLEKVRGQIANYLKQNRKNIQKEQFLSQLKLKTKVETKLVSPPVQRIKVEAGDNPAIGPENAKVTVIEFTDYQCPFCGKARPTVQQMIDTYKDNLRYVLRDFPLSFHQDSFAAHVASHCAGEQGKYWEYNKILFNSQTALKPDKLKEYAKQVGLDTKKFDECLDSNKYAGKIQQNMEEASKAGVSGTPSFFINGIMISGAQPFSKFKEIIDEELKK